MNPDISFQPNESFAMDKTEAGLAWIRNFIHGGFSILGAHRRAKKAQTLGTRKENLMTQACAFGTPRAFYPEAEKPPFRDPLPLGRLFPGFRHSG